MCLKSFSLPQMAESTSMSFISYFVWESARQTFFPLPQ